MSTNFPSACRTCRASAGCYRRAVALETEVARQRREHDQDLFDRFKALHVTGLPIATIAH
jgi:hypothetical protein